MGCTSSEENQVKEVQVQEKNESQEKKEDVSEKLHAIHKSFIKGKTEEIASEENDFRNQSLNENLSQNQIKNSNEGANPKKNLKKKEYKTHKFNLVKRVSLPELDVNQFIDDTQVWDIS